jgi:hypothetical protein
MGSRSPYGRFSGQFDQLEAAERLVRQFDADHAEVAWAGATIAQRLLCFIGDG